MNNSITQFQEGDLVRIIQPDVGWIGYVFDTSEKPNDITPNDVMLVIDAPTSPHSLSTIIRVLCRRGEAKAFSDRLEKIL